MIFFIKILVSKLEGWKGRHFNGRSRAALSLATPLSLDQVFCKFFER